MAGSGEKKSRARRLAALYFWGAICGVTFAVTLLLLAVFAWPALLSRGGLAMLAAQAALHALCVWRISEAAALADDAHSALDVSAEGGRKSDGSEVWKDIVYVNSFCALLRPFTQYGGWVWLLAVPAFIAWRTAATILPFFTARAGAQGGNGPAGDDGGAPANARSAKRQRQEDAAEKRRKGR